MLFYSSALRSAVFTLLPFLIVDEDTVQEENITVVENSLESAGKCLFSSTEV